MIPAVGAAAAAKYGALKATTRFAALAPYGSRLPPLLAGGRRAPAGADAA